MATTSRRRTTREEERKERKDKRGLKEDKPEPNSKNHSRRREVLKGSRKSLHQKTFQRPRRRSWRPRTRLTGLTTRKWRRCGEATSKGVGHGK